MPLTIAPKEWFMSKVELRTPELFRERCFVGGNWLDAGSHETLTVDNPATGEVIGRVPNFDGQDTAQAIAQAEQALDRKSTRLNSSHAATPSPLFCLKNQNSQ